MTTPTLFFTWLQFYIQFACPLRKFVKESVETSQSPVTRHKPDTKLLQERVGTS